MAEKFCYPAYSNCLPHWSIYFWDNRLKRSINFLSNTQAYNSAFQMTSFGCDEIKARTVWNPCFKLHGHIYHSIESLASPENSTAKFAQIYFVSDDKVQSSLHQTVIQDLRSDIVDQLQHMMLHQSNSYARSLKMALDISSCHSQELQSSLMPISNHLMSTKEDSMHHYPTKLAF